MISYSFQINPKPQAALPISQCTLDLNSGFSGARTRQIFLALFTKRRSHGSGCWCNEFGWVMTIISVLSRRDWPARRVDQTREAAATPSSTSNTPRGRNRWDVGRGGAGQPTWHPAEEVTAVTGWNFIVGQVRLAAVFEIRSTVILIVRQSTSIRVNGHDEMR